MTNGLTKAESPRKIPENNKNFILKNLRKWIEKNKKIKKNNPNKVSVKKKLACMIKLRFSEHKMPEINAISFEYIKPIL